ncbi:MAG: hypothetical protein JWL73_3229 [Actinomycetia bacterium]|nr:hypothetical protein [Actinomycetes bacterium]
MSKFLRHLPVRLATGAFILNSGLSKRKADAETAKGIHGFASTAYPQLANLDAEKFVKLLSTGEIAVGTALLLPIVPARLAGAALTGFAAGLVGLYLRVPGMHDEQYRPTQQGIPVAKDIWMLGIGLSLMVDG